MAASMRSEENGQIVLRTTLSEGDVLPPVYAWLQVHQNADIIFAKFMVRRWEHMLCLRNHSMLQVRACPALYAACR